MSEIKIEKVELADSQKLLDIYAYYVEKTAVSFEYEVPSLKEFEDRIRNISAKYPYLKAVKDGEIIGYAYAGTFKPRKAYDHSVEITIYLLNNQRRQGTGSLLYEALEKSLREMGILNMNACIALAKKEDEYLTFDSVYFHEKMGFKRVGVFHDSGYKFNRWYDMVWMEKMIGEHLTDIKEVEFSKWDI